MHLNIIENYNYFIISSQKSTKQTYFKELQFINNAQKKYIYLWDLLQYLVNELNSFFN